MCVVVHGYGGLGYGGGGGGWYPLWTKSGVLVACREMPEHFQSTRYTGNTHHTAFQCAPLYRIEPQFVYLLAKALALGAKRRVRFVVYAAVWLHSMVHH